jgi:hypothetical protein
MLKSKSALFTALLLATQFAAAGGLVIEKQATPPFDQSPNGSVILENRADNGGVVLEKGIIVQNQLAGGVILENTSDTQDAGGVIIEKSPVLERGGIKLLSGSLMLEKSPVLERGGIKLLSGIMVPDRKLAGGMIVDKHLAGGLIIDRHGRNV